MAVDIPRWRTLGADAVTNSPRRRRRKRAGRERDQVPMLELLESRRLLAAGGRLSGSCHWGWAGYERLVHNELQ